MNKISRSIAASGLMMLGVWPVCQASPVSFVLDYSGAAFGNTALARATLTIEDTLFPNPQDGLTFLYVGDGAITDFSLTVAGASTGNGTFGLAVFDYFTWDTVGTALDFSQNLVGQFMTGGGWGTTQDFLSGTFNFFALDSSPDAPTATLNAFQFATAGGNGGALNLTSFSPVAPAPVAVPLPAPFLMLLGTLLPLISLWVRRIR